MLPLLLLCIGIASGERLNRQVFNHLDPPSIDEVETWAKYFQSRVGYDLSWARANDKAFEVLGKAHPKMEDVKEWAKYFQSRVGYDLSWARANDKAFEVLGKAHPKLEDVKEWAEEQFRASHNIGWSQANDKAFDLLGKDASSLTDPDLEMGYLPQESAEEPADEEPAEEPEPVQTKPPPKMLDCPAPAKPAHGDPFGRICKEGLRRGNIPHGHACTPVCGLGHAPVPPSLRCENGVIGSFQCPEFQHPLEVMCKKKCGEEGKGYQWALSGGESKCDCI